MIEQIKNELADAYDYFIVPKAVLDVPIGLEKMQREDGSYYTLNELSKELGSLFTFVDVIDTRFVKFRWAVPANGEEALIISYLKSKGLVDMRDNGIDDSLNFTVNEIDFVNLKGNEFGFFKRFEMKFIPGTQLVEEMI